MEISFYTFSGPRKTSICDMIDETVLPHLAQVCGVNISDTQRVDKERENIPMHTLIDKQRDKEIINKAIVCRYEANLTG